MLEKEKGMLAQRFRNFAKHECKDSSELYEFLSKQIAEDKELLELCTHTRAGQPIPNMLFGAVHYLLLKGTSHRLREYYPSIVQEPKDIKASFIPFQDFCLHHKAEIQTLLESKLVQTNEIRRCAYLYPSFCYMYNITKKPLALIEIGTSAGLQLLWDTYSYSYINNGTVYGNSQSSVHISSEIKGMGSPLLYADSPPVTWKVGIDLHVSDVNDPADVQWLEALIWPEHQERLALFKNAVKQMQENPVKLIEGDGVALLPEVAEKAPKDATICVFHTHVANQISKELKLKLLQNIKRIGSKRDIFHLYNNIWDGDLHLDYVVGGKEYHHTIGETDGHGRWFSWNLFDGKG
ncbi:DUF2332 domain-containing protein [Virgibacillus pantothenticus]|uniref:DUF2332 domain-containing protein n=1 Tax=Virgibacillus pantothenticus TaxID=1473 RepID=UPI001C2359A0|nr:DUF2332 domain-containing protein [Virgibacillus pantothenticus]MBU8567037.1 DUF2332 domain-containing protein [Virgibacillus pantothenticus]MBU8601961.1 DUF2332 domain-containing protein [Virgibacillus pantothenticus]MBU8635064.1 DUF2332 domain-containing protein [Virgibacillus pantothenticus]MBU8642893.1 DUF2332 domain-containing protein [Virgibacillus pantothenticus]MBU8646821.1 DUF2332 domain-containing protein [Virgibacillus pantothenticus]